MAVRTCRQRYPRLGGCVAVFSVAHLRKLELEGLAPKRIAFGSLKLFNREQFMRWLATGQVEAAVPEQGQLAAAM